MRYILMLSLLSVGVSAAAEAKDRTRNALVVGANISDNEYVMEARKAGAEGTTTVEFIIDERGKPASCVISQKSASPLLDDKTCEIILKRFKFKPALDASGVKIAEPWVFGITWKLPKDLIVLGPAPRP